MGTHPIFESDFDCPTAFYQDMNQEISRNDLKNQIKEIRSANSEIKQKLQALHKSGTTIESRKAYFKLLEENNYERDDFRKMIGIYSQMPNQSVTDATKQFDIE